MSRMTDEWDYDWNEKFRAKLVDRMATFLESPENWNRLKEAGKATQSEDLRQLLTEALNAVYPNPYKKTMFGCYYNPDPPYIEMTKEVNR